MNKNIKYDVFLIFSTNLNTVAVETILKNWIDLMASNMVKIIEKRHLGIKPLAYPIKKFLTGYYEWLKIEFMDNKDIGLKIANFNRIFKNHNDILRVYIGKNIPNEIVDEIENYEGFNFKIDLKNN